MTIVDLKLDILQIFDQKILNL